MAKKNNIGRYHFLTAHLTFLPKTKIYPAGTILICKFRQTNLMRKKIFSFSLLILLCIYQVNACSTFLLSKNGELVFGRNYDWITGAGLVCTNHVGLYKTSVKNTDGNTTSWVSRYGSITFNQYGKEFPTGGMNDQGLVVELMWADGTKYPHGDDRPALGVLQWIQYQLDNNKTVEEVIASDKVIRISSNNPPLHYLIADASGKAATIEFFEGKLLAHKGSDLPFAVLTNNPYLESVKAAKAAKNSSDTTLSFLGNSLQRFAKACSMVQKFTEQKVTKAIVPYAFDILNNVAQPGFTQWSIVYDLKNKKIHFKTRDFQEIKSVAFAGFDFSCSATPQALNMNQLLKGEVNENFIAFNNDLNRKILEQSASESKSRVSITEKETEKQLAYPATISCNTTR